MNAAIQDFELEKLRRDGELRVARVFSPEELESLRLEAERILAGEGLGRGGLREVLGKSPAFAELAGEGMPARLARQVLGPASRVRKATLFDKTPAANWKVPWHQDLTIAVAERREIEGFRAWSRKEGVHHVQPPADILAATLAVRVHLDDAGADNGALRVVPGSHLFGRLEDEEVNRLRAELGERTCEVAAGDVHLFFPLLLHASSASTRAGHRRVLHLEYSAADLPDGLQWAR